ncbi:hypothetical protein DCAR_0832749 [Daucus carota subsp. sativus]|uniref:Uncharacterized protein n=1 Tax=Daucus carota subsp. sativus TaxID=79200 RepID=A0A175YS57_DAUCS|nr:hypothetical protein DCAR_0832749 [Daucus carota subsp. sativus]
MERVLDTRQESESRSPSINFILRIHKKLWQSVWNEASVRKNTQKKTFFLAHSSKFGPVPESNVAPLGLGSFHDAAAAQTAVSDYGRWWRRRQSEMPSSKWG